MGLFGVAISGLNAAQVGILTASNNISNASTAGYNRQEIVQGTNVPTLTGNGYIGQGTHVTTVKRIYDQYLSRQVLSAEAGAAEMDSYLAQIKQIDNLLADSSAGLSPALAAFFKGVQEVAANPSSIPGRQSMLSAAQALTGRFQALDQRMSEIRDGVNTQIINQVTEINTYATQLAEINQKLVFATSGSLTQIPNDLLDQRDQMLRNLNQLVRVSTVTNTDGSMSVFVGSGQPLVVGNTSYSFTAVASNEDPERMVVALRAAGGTTLTLPESQMSGGSLGGLLSFRSQTLDSAQNALGRIAMTLAQNFNDQHNLGIDLTGALGADFFAMPTPVWKGSALNTGTGNPTVTIDVANIDELTTSDYRLTFDGVDYQLTRLSDSTVTPITAVPQVVDGMSIDTSTWTPATNDSFLIQPTRGGARNFNVAILDPRSIAAAVPIRTSSNLANTGTATIDAGVVPKPTPPATLDPNLREPVTITFTSATTFDVSGLGTGNPAGVAYTSGGAISYNGWTIHISGTPATGDVFTVSVNSNGVADNRNAMLLGSLQTQSTMLGGATYGPTASYQSAYSQIVSEVGSKANEVIAIGEAQQGLAEQAISSMQQISGVNLDEEAANLLRYQQAYQASAKILEIAGRIFDEVIALGR